MCLSTRSYATFLSELIRNEERRKGYYAFGWILLGYLLGSEYRKVLRSKLANIKTQIEPLHIRPAHSETRCSLGERLRQTAHTMFAFNFHRNLLDAVAKSNPIDSINDFPKAFEPVD